MESVVKNIEVEKTLTKLDGTAPNPINEKGHKIISNINGPKVFILHETFINIYDPDKSIITIDMDAGIIELNTNIVDTGHNVTVVGKMKEYAELKKLNINSYRYITLKEMLDLLRPARRLFNDKDRHSTLMDDLTNFKMKYETNIEKADDRKGNSSASFAQVVKDSKDLNFTLTSQVYGDSKLKFEVVVLVEIREKAVLFALESIELMEIMLDQKEAIIKTEISEIFEKIKVIEI